MRLNRQKMDFGLRKKCSPNIPLHRHFFSLVFLYEFFLVFVLVLFSLLFLFMCLEIQGLNLVSGGVCNKAPVTYQTQTHLFVFTFSLLFESYSFSLFSLSLSLSLSLVVYSSSSFLILLVYSLNKYF